VFFKLCQPDLGMVIDTGQDTRVARCVFLEREDNLQSQDLALWNPRVRVAKIYIVHLVVAVDDEQHVGAIQRGGLNEQLPQMRVDESPFRYWRMQAHMTGKLAAEAAKDRPDRELSVASAGVVRQDYPTSLSEVGEAPHKPRRQHRFAPPSLPEQQHCLLTFAHLGEQLPHRTAPTADQPFGPAAPQLLVTLPAHHLIEVGAGEALVLALRSLLQHSFGLGGTHTRRNSSCVR